MALVFRRPFFALATLTAGYLGFRHLATRIAPLSRFPVGRTPDDVGPNFREVRFGSTDGLALAAWWVPAEGSSRAAVLVHGRRGSKASPYVVETARIYARAGFSVLMLDLRGRGGSEGRFLTGGYQEVRDVHGALRWLAGRGFEPGRIVLHGWSTGAVTVVRAAPGTGVGAVVEESGYADLPLLLGGFAPGSRSGPSRFLTRAAFLAARLLGVEFDPWALRPREDAARLYEEGVPLFVVHSRRDGVIPFEHAALIAAAHREAAFWEIEERGHASAYTHPEYAKKLLGFLDERLGEADRRTLA